MKFQFKSIVFMAFFALMFIACRDNAAQQPQDDATQTEEAAPAEPANSETEAPVDTTGQLSEDMQDDSDSE